MAVNLTDEFEAPAQVDLAGEFEAPAPVQLADEFEAPEQEQKPGLWERTKAAVKPYLPITETEYQRQIAAGERVETPSLVGKMVQAAGQAAFSGNLAPLDDVMFNDGGINMVADTTARMGPPMLMAAAGPVGWAGLVQMAAAGALGESMAQSQQMARGERQDISARDLAGAAVAAPIGIRVLPRGVSPLRAVAQGSLEGVTASTISAGIGERDITAEELALAGTVGAFFRGVQAAGSRRAMMDEAMAAARKLGWQGRTADDLRGWYEEARFERARPASPERAPTPAEAPASGRIDGPDATGGTPPPSPDAPAPGGGGGAMAEFEARAGIAPAPDWEMEAALRVARDTRVKAAERNIRELTDKLNGLPSESIGTGAWRALVKERAAAKEGLATLVDKLWREGAGETPSVPAGGTSAQAAASVPKSTDLTAEFEAPAVVAPAGENAAPVEIPVNETATPPIAKPAAQGTASTTDSAAGRGELVPALSDGVQAAGNVSGLPAGVKAEELAKLTAARARELFGSKLDKATHRAAVVQAIAEGAKVSNRVKTSLQIPVERAGRIRPPSRADGEMDLIDAIFDMGGIRSPHGLRNVGGEYDGYAESTGSGVARWLRNAKGGLTVDQMVEDLAEAGFKFDSPDALWRGIESAVKERHRVAKVVADERYRSKMETAMFENKGRPVTQRSRLSVRAQDLDLGSKFYVRGELMEVVSIDPETEALKLRGASSVFEVPPDAVIHVDGANIEAPPPVALSGDEPFESAAPWRGGLSGATRYRQLSERVAAGSQLSPVERAELEGFERAAGQAYVPGSMDAAAVAGDAAQAAAAVKARQSLEMRARAEARLIGGGLELQGDMFGAPSGDTGSLFEPSAVMPYLERAGVLDPELQADAVARIGRDMLRVAQLEFSLPYAQTLRGTAGGTALARASASRMATGRDEIAGWLRDPVKYAGPLAGALRVHGRVSSIVADYFTGELPAWSPVGKTIVTPQDVAAIMVPLRNPYTETFKAVVVNAQGRILHAEVLHVGDMTSVSASPQAVLRAVARGKGRRVILSHNHPGGDPSPSAADYAVHQRMETALAEAGVELVDDVVTNGYSVWSFRTESLLDVESPEPSLWERVPRRELVQVNSPQLAAQVAGALRQSNPDGVFAVMLTNKLQVTAIEQLPANASQQDMLRLLSTGVSREGANGLVLGARRLDPAVVRAIASKLLSQGVRVLDVSTEVQASWANAGLLSTQMESAPLAADGRVAREAGEEFGAFDRNAPIVLADAKARGAEVYAKVELARLDDIPIVQMPELVRMVRELTGRMPDIRKMARALGTFNSGNGIIKLDPRIFRDSTLAAKILGHEIGHLTDWLGAGDNNKVMARGNLLGRIASLRKFLATTLPLKPGVGGGSGRAGSFSPKDRAALRRQAEKAVGGKPARDEPAEMAAWREQVSIKYAELLQDELEARGLIVLKSGDGGVSSVIGASRSDVGIREELIGLSEYWKPVPETAPDSYVSYRQSAEELYADALSVLLNSPATLKAMAPTFYEAFFNHLDAKPAIKAEFFAMWDFLNRPYMQVLQKRSADIQGMFVKGDEILMRKAAERKARYDTFRGWADRFRQELFDVFDPLVRRGEKLERAGTTIPYRYNPRTLFDEHPLADNANYRMMQRLWENVIKPVEADEFTLDDLGEYLFLKRVLNERFDVEDINDVGGGRSQLANPLGITPEAARLGLLRMRLDAGWERFARLEIAADKFHDIVFEAVEAAVEVGAYNRKTFETRLAPNKDNYAAFAVLDYLQDYVPASIRMGQGTFKEIANPFTATVLKTVSLYRLIQTQKSKRGAVEFLQQFDPVSVAKAESRFDGKRWVVEPPRDADKALLEVLENGRPAGYYVDPVVAEMFDKLTPARASAVATVLNWPFRKIVYPLIIQYNPAFQLFLGVGRDLRRTWVNVPAGKGLVSATVQTLRNYGAFLGLPKTEAAAAVRAYLRGEPHPLIAEMIANQAIGTPLDNFARDLTRSDPMEKIMRDFGLLPKEKQGAFLRSAAMKPALALGEAIEFAGLTFEMLPKVSTYKMLTQELGWNRKEAAYFVRNSVGVPNIKRKGKHTMLAEALTPFFKVFVNGLRSDLRLMTHPKSAGGWWVRWAATDGIWTVLQALAGLGLLGAAVKELYDGISEYDKTNYNVIPLGSTEGGEFGKRVMRLRMPRDEVHRLVSGLLYQGIMAAGGETSKGGVSSVLAFGADQVPGLNPVLELAGGWKDYLEGDNPMDGFRGRPVLSNAEWLAGGWPAMSGMIGWSAEQTGVTNFIRWDSRAETWQQMTLSAVPGMNRIIGVTDTGYRERQEAQLRGEARERAELRVALPDNAQRLLGEYYHLSRIGAKARTVQQTQRYMELAKWRNMTYKPIEDMLWQKHESDGGWNKALMRQLESASRMMERK